MSPSTAVSCDSVQPTISVPVPGQSETQLQHYRPLATDWQRDIVAEYYSGSQRHVEVSERSLGGQTRSLTFNGQGIRDTLYDVDDPSAYHTPTAQCQHQRTSTFHWRVIDGFVGGFARSTVCNVCASVFRNYRDFGDVPNREYRGV